jgi:precorrin-6B methylase 2
LVFVLIVLLLEMATIVAVVWVVWSATIGAPWLPTPKSSVRRMLEIAEVNSDDVLYDLGSGDGRIIVMAAEEFGAKSIGIEADPLRVFWARRKIKKRGLQDRTEVIRGNFFKTDLSDATVVTLYLGHKVNMKIREKLAEDLKPGTRVVSYRFLVSGWTPVLTSDDPSVYLYVR